MLIKEIEIDIDRCLKVMEIANKRLHEALQSNDDDLFKTATELYKAAQNELQELKKLREKHESRNVIGRPSLGVTKKVSITLPEEVWTFLDEKVKETESNRSAVLRDILINAYEGDISWFEKVFGQDC